DSTPIDQEQPLAKTRKIAGRKPVLRAPTPTRGRGRFARKLGTPVAPTVGKKGRSATGSEPTDRRSGNYEDDRVIDDEFVDADDQAEEAAAETEGSESQIDDPVRIYLMQMGEIPLLSRPEEIESAKRIENTRRRFRHSMLASDYLLQGAVALLEKVRDGKLRLDRTIEVSVTNTAGKKKIIARLGPNLV